MSCARSVTLVGVFLSAFFFSVPSYAAAFTLHLTGNADPAGTGCTGNGLVDLIACDGPFLTPAPATLSTSPAARWVLPQASSLDGTNGRTIYDPSWIWIVPGTVNLGGKADIKWWASCSDCVALGGTWNIRIWTDNAMDTPTFQQTVTATPALPGVPSLLSASVVIPSAVMASESVVLHIDPALPMGPDTVIYYDSASACPGAMGSDPCDSTITFGGTVNDNGNVPATVRAANASDASFTIHTAPNALNNLLLGSAEPTLDINYKTGDVFYRFSLGTARVNNFNEATGAATWTDASDLASSLVGLDPFLGGGYKLNDDGRPDTATDSRIFTLQLLAATSAMSYSDDNGETWTPTQGGGEPMVVDNQSLGSGPYPDGFPLDPIISALGPGYAVYYCGHTFVNAFCSRSDDGGQTFNPPTPIFPVEGLCNNHGHVKVGADGTVYVPINNTCLGTEGVTLSTDGGITWNYVGVPDTVRGRWDPSIAIARDGMTLYFAYAEEGEDEPMVIKGRLVKGPTPTIEWGTAVNVGTPAGLKNIVFSTAVAGDADRAAVIFHGTTKGGNSGDKPSMEAAPIAVWHLYAAMTYDGGKTWGLRNLTPSDPTQKGSICDGGTGCMNTPNDRNLLDFMDAVIDKEGRIVVSFTDGCTGSCVSGSGAPNYADLGAIARQSGGKRMYVANDPVIVNTAPTSALSANPTAVTAGQSVNFTVTLSDAESNALRYTLDFGDGTSAATGTVGGVVNHVYASATGSPFTARLTVVETDATPALSASAKSADITVNPVTGGNQSPTAVLSAPGIGTVGQSVAMSGANSSDPDGDTLTYAFSFGDGGTSAVKDPSHTYTAAGTYTITLTVSDGRGGSDTDTRDIVISTNSGGGGGGGTPPQARLSSDKTAGESPLTVNFDAGGSTGAGPLTYTFLYGDGETSAPQSGATASHQYTAACACKAKVLVRDAAGNTHTSDAITIAVDTTVTVTPGEAEKVTTALLEIVGANSGPAPLTVTFDATRSFAGTGRRITSYRFDFDDGTEPVIGTDLRVSHVYTTPGSYQPSLTVTDEVQTQSRARISVGIAPSGVVSSAISEDASSRPVTIGTSAGRIESLTKVAAPPASLLPADLAYPVGFFAYDITGLARGATTTISVVLPNGVSADGYLKCTPRDCRSLPVTVSGNVLSFTLKDGGPDDEDGVENGIIKDPGAPTLSAPAAASALLGERGGALDWLTLLPLLLLARRRR